MGHLPAEPFFLDASPGKRFCLYHPPARQLTENGAFLYIHPFAEEMNKSRRMAALQCRAFAAMGLGVLQIDLYGCGDSEGDFGDAAWEIWRSDITFARQWLIDKGYDSIHLWGLRLGALLALDCARHAKGDFGNLVLWQPVISGQSFLTQFLRLKLVNELMAKNGNQGMNVQALREILKAGKALEIAGYTLAPSMASAIDNLRMRELIVDSSVINWLEIVPNDGRKLSPASESVLDTWNQFGLRPKIELIVGQPFWATQEISECPALIAATTMLFSGTGS
ncbi:hydrolase 2, exosortase A system-associated [Nitrosomonas sp. ANs5]|uniref:hydrolase 2, exosortase A system-associated n=1 Tax=Nitrosomonas sp. ANs5 TaxID=3423941 RepID=UPI003D3272B4